MSAVGHVKAGDLVMSLTIWDGEDRVDAGRLFIDVLGYWENLLRAEGLIAAEHRMPDKIIEVAMCRPMDRWRDHVRFAVDRFNLLAL